MTKEVIYYAHCMIDYHTNKSTKHKEALMRMGFDIVDPSNDIYQTKVEEMISEGKTSKEIMDYFLEVVVSCHHLAFSLTDEGKVSAGAWKEIQTMKEKGGTIIQMPNLDNLDVMSVEETRAYLRS